MTSFKITFPRLLIAGLIASSATIALAQPAPAAPAGAHPTAHEHKGARGRATHGPAEHQAAMAKRQTELKQQLQITSAQEPAWNLFTASMLPDARPGTRPDREALRAMTTPQRVEHMRAQRAERDAGMDRRADATLKLYAALTPEQQKVFDARTARQHGDRPHGGPRGPHPVPHKG